MSGFDPEALRAIVAEMAGLPASQIDASFSLQTPALASSIKKAALVAAIRRRLGVQCLQAVLAKTFGELQGLVEAAAAGAAPAAAEQAAPAEGELSCGVDMESLSELPRADDYRAHEFYVEHFSRAERDYCASQPDPVPHFAARWCAKEALRKADNSFMNVPHAEVEVARDESGKVWLRRVGGPDLPYALSLSHTPTTAAAVVVGRPPKRGLLSALFGR